MAPLSPFIRNQKDLVNGGDLLRRNDTHDSLTELKASKQKEVVIG